MSFMLYLFWQLEKFLRCNYLIAYYRLMGWTPVVIFQWRQIECEPKIISSDMTRIYREFKKITASRKASFKLWSSTKAFGNLSKVSSCCGGPGRLWCWLGKYDTQCEENKSTLINNLFICHIIQFDKVQQWSVVWLMDNKGQQTIYNFHTFSEFNGWSLCWVTRNVKWWMTESPERVKSSH